jgi:hypothetical protein
MSNQPQAKIRNIISEYIALGRPAETSKIAEYVLLKLGIKPSRTTIGNILRENGLTPIEQPRFVWRHKQEVEDE